LPESEPKLLVLADKSLVNIRHRREDNIKLDLQEVGGGVKGWIEMARDRDRWRALVNAVMNLRVP